VNGKNQSLSDDDNAIIFKIIGDVADDDVIDDDDEEGSVDPSQSYEEIDSSIPISKGPLRIENPEKIPLLNSNWKPSQE
jgi:hypothetical protein